MACQAKTLILLIVLAVSYLGMPPASHGNDRVRKAVLKYEQRMEDERAKVMAIFAKELETAKRRKDEQAQRLLLEARTAWIDQEMMITERGGLRFFNGAVESFGPEDFQFRGATKGDFFRNNNVLAANNGTATVAFSKPARGLYFRGIIESKHNFHILLNQEGADRTKDICVVFGGWNNSRSELQLNQKTIARAPFGMPKRWLCEIYISNGEIRVLANETMLMNASIGSQLRFKSASILVDYDSQTKIVSPSVKVN
ncbi:MAG: hypothetical protein AB8B55_20430 [Mariniblastus sp.]